MGALGGFLGKIGRGIGAMWNGTKSWIMGKGKDIAKNGISSLANRLMDSKAGGYIKEYGPKVANFVGEEVFNKSMRKFGDTIQNKINGSKLGPVMDGINVGDAYAGGMRKAFDFIKTGGTGYGSSLQVPNSVEKTVASNEANAYMS